MCDNLKLKFWENIQLIKNIETDYDDAFKSVNELKARYSELLKTNTKKIFLFSLDSIYSDYKIYTLELEHIDTLKKMLNNRMYTEFFKLFQIIQKYLNEIRVSYEPTDLKEYPPCKELEQFYEYKIENIENIFENILFFIELLKTHIDKLNKDIENHENSNDMDFSINNFILTLKSENLLIKNQLDLFENYLLFFLSNHNKQLLRLLSGNQRFHRTPPPSARAVGPLYIPPSVGTYNSIPLKKENPVVEVIENNVVENTVVKVVENPVENENNIQIEIIENNNEPSGVMQPEVMYE